MTSLDLPPAAARLECSGAIHHLIWRAGSLETPDHDDPDAERALAALGGEPCRCVEMLDAWDAFAADPRILILGPRGNEHLPPRREDRVGRRAVSRGRRPGTTSTMMVTGGGSSATGGENRDGEESLFDLLTLGGGLPRRLVASAAQALDDRLEDPTLQSRLFAALYGRALASFTTWRGADAQAPEFSFELIPSGGSPSFSESADRCRLALPFTWLSEVWGGGLDIVADQFILAAQSDPSGGWILTGVDRVGQVNTCTLAPQ